MTTYHHVTTTTNTQPATNTHTPASHHHPQDLAVVVLLMLIPLLAPSPDGSATSMGTIAKALGIAGAKAVACIVGVIAVGRVVVKPMFDTMAGLKNQDIFTALALTMCLATSMMTQLAGLSLALGAFLAGLLIAETKYAHKVSRGAAGRSRAGATTHLPACAPGSLPACTITDWPVHTTALVMPNTRVQLWCQLRLLGAAAAPAPLVPHLPLRPWCQPCPPLFTTHPSSPPQVEHDIAPFKGLLMGLFFMTVGMKISVELFAANFVGILGTIALLVGGKIAIMAALGPAFGLPLSTSIRSGMMLAPGGEFAFVAFGVAVSQGVLPAALCNQLYVVVALSMAMVPYLAAGSEGVAQMVEAKLGKSLPPSVGGDQGSGPALQPAT